MSENADRATVSEVLCRALVREGVSTIFGHPGGAILPFYDALYRLGAPEHVLVRHEQAAAHAADGYARATGRVGVCVATSGPGATNLVTGLAAAFMDGVPIVAITGQVASASRGTDAFQETDIYGIAMPVTKYAFVLEDPADTERIVHEAFDIARSGRAGPVLIDVPKDIQNAVVPLRRTIAPTAASAPATPPTVKNAVDAEAVQRAAALVNRAKRPVLLVGRGVIASGTAPLVRELAERAHLPVVTTLLALDAFPATHPQAAGMPGMHGTERANLALQRADVVLGLGVRFDDRVIGRPGSFAPHASIIHFDIDPGCVGRTVRPALAVLGDLRETLPALLARITPATRPDWWARLEQWQREAAPPGDPWNDDGPMTARSVCRAIAERVAATRAIVVTDVGQHQMLIAQELRDAEPGTHLTSGGLGTMGYALPAAIGASFAGTGRPVWAVAGDGGFQMTMQELATIAQYRLPLRIAVVNNGYLGMVRQWQELFYGRRYSASRMQNPDLVLLAGAYGIPARCVHEPADLAPTLDWLEAVRGPALVELRVPSEENVYPMVCAGRALDEIAFDPALVAVG